MAWQTVKTWAFKETLSSADMNTYIRDNMNASDAHPNGIYVKTASASVRLANNLELAFDNLGGSASATIKQLTSNHLRINNPDGYVQVYKNGSGVEFRLESLISGTTYGLYLGADANNAYIGTYTNHVVRLIVNASEKGRLETSGQLSWYGNIVANSSIHANGALSTASTFQANSTMQIMNGADFRLYNPGNTLYNSIHTNASNDLELYAAVGEGIHFVTGGTPRWFMNDVGTFRPVVDAAHDVGSSVHRVDDYYGTNSAINTSDIREKDVVEGYEVPGLDFIDALNSIAFKWKSVKKTVDGEIVEKPEAEKRIHIGFSAQQVEEVLAAQGLSTQDFAALIIDEASGRYGLRMAEFIPILAKGMQEIKGRLEALESQ